MPIKVQEGVSSKPHCSKQKEGSNNSKFMTPKGTVALVNVLSKKGNGKDKGEGKWHEAKLDKTVINYGGSYQVARYRLQSGVVLLEGVLKKGKGSKPPKDVLTLPSGYRPKKRLVFQCHGEAGPVRVDILSNARCNARPSIRR